MHRPLQEQLTNDIASLAHHPSQCARRGLRACVYQLHAIFASIAVAAGIQTTQDWQDYNNALYDFEYWSQRLISVAVLRGTLKELHPEYASTGQEPS